MKYRPTRQRGARRFFIPRAGGNDDGRYNDARYRRAAAEQLKRCPTCQIQTHCQGAPATQADHIREIKGPFDPGLFDPANLQSACAACNTAKSHKHRRKGDDAPLADAQGGGVGHF